MMANQRVLIVDDETKVAFFLQESLKALGENLEVLSVTSAEAALGEIEQEAVDLLVTDQRMPGLSGTELITRVRQRHPDTQTILITAYGTDQVANEAKRLQVHHYFTKPFHIEDFIQTALEALGSSQAPPISSRLSSQCVDAVSQRLESLRREIGAQGVIAAASSGRVVAQAGAAVGLELEPLLSLVADGFGASSALALHLGGDHMTNLNYYEGAVYDLYLAHIDDSLILAIIFDRRIQASRIGIVWLYARRAIEALRRILVVPRPAKASPGLSLDGSSPDQAAAPLAPLTHHSPVNV